MAFEVSLLILEYLRLRSSAMASMAARASSSISLSWLLLMQNRARSFVIGTAGNPTVTVARPNRFRNSSTNARILEGMMRSTGITGLSSSPYVISPMRCSFCLKGKDR